MKRMADPEEKVQPATVMLTKPTEHANDATFTVIRTDEETVRASRKRRVCEPPVGYEAADATI